MLNLRTKPDRSESPEYFWKYIDQVPDGDIRHILESQAVGLLALVESISDVRSRHRYAPDKWSIREVLGHVNDTERVFVFRAFWFARGFASALPSFDQSIAVSAAEAGARSWKSLVVEPLENRVTVAPAQVVERASASWGYGERCHLPHVPDEQAASRE
jgi:hypothetical protein